MAQAKKSSGDTSAVTLVVRRADGQRVPARGLWNISLGGIFVELEEPLAFGAEVGLEFTLNSEPRSLRCQGFVVWSSKTAPDKAHGKTGAAFRLTDIGIAQMRRLADTIERQLSA